MAHQFLREALRDTGDRELRREGVSQRVEHELAAHRVNTRDFRRLDVAADQAVRIVAALEDALIIADVRKLGRLQFRQQLGVNRHERLAPVFRRAGTDDDVRTLVIELEIAPHELAKFVAAQAGVGGSNVEEAMRASHGEQPVELVVGERAALALPAARVRLRHALERVRCNAALTIHPIEKRVRSIQIFVQGLRAELLLARAPGDEAVGRHVAEVFPTALGAELRDAGLHLTAVDFGAAERGQVGDKIREMREQGLLGRLALHFRSEQAGAFALRLGDDLGELFLGDLFVGRFERDFGDGVVAFEAEAATVDAAGDDFAGGIPAARFEDVGNHGRRAADFGR